MPENDKSVDNLLYYHLLSIHFIILFPSHNITCIATEIKKKWREGRHFLSCQLTHKYRLVLCMGFSPKVLKIAYAQISLHYWIIKQQIQFIYLIVGLFYGQTRSIDTLDQLNCTEVILIKQSFKNKISSSQSISFLVYSFQVFVICSISSRSHDCC